MILSILIIVSKVILGLIITFLFFSFIAIIIYIIVYIINRAQIEALEDALNRKKRSKNYYGKRKKQQEKGMGFKKQK